MASRADCEQLFLKADVNNDGYLSYDETVAMLRANGFKGSDQQLRGFFEAADTSCDDKISMEEYLVVMGHLPPKITKGALMRRVFCSFDKDKNGVIDRKELKDIFAEMGKHLNEEEAEKLMSLVDTNQDGHMDYEEFIDYFFGDGDAKQ